MISIEEMATFCKKKGFVFPNSEIYGGMSGFWDYGPLGSEMKKNLKDSWWKFHVQSRDDIVGIDGSIITNPKVWKASGHVDSFKDVSVVCLKCKKFNKVDKHELETASCSFCDGELDKESALELEQMMTTQVGPMQQQSTKAYLRPETAQLMFVDFKHCVDSARLKLPFGIAQMGRAFRNEIAPRDFLFRCREFEQMEIEYFIHPKDTNKCPWIKEVLKHKIMVYSDEMQEKGKEGKVMTMEEALKKKIIKTQWHAYWLATEHQWFISMGAKAENFRIRQHVSDEKSHYALDTWDLEYNFPFGWKELQGMANRTDYDLQQHIKHSKKDLSIFIEETKEKVVPHVVAEPSQGVERAFLVLMFDAYNDDKKRGNVVLKFTPKIAPIKLGVFPLVNKLKDDAKKVYDDLKDCYTCQFDTSGSVGRRYARADEIGIPYCITFDFDSLEDKSVTVRDRDSTEQIRVPIAELKDVIYRLMVSEVEFSKAGKLVK